MLIILFSLRREDKHKDIFVAGALLLVSAVSLPAVTAITSGKHLTLDNYFFLADRILDLDTWNLAHVVSSHHWAWGLVLTSYYILPLFVSIAWIAERSVIMICTLIVASVISPLFYLAFPAIGPACAFPGFPWNNPHVAERLMVVYKNLPRNAFPSLHFAWALLIYMNCQRKSMRFAALIFVFLTALATMGSGEHYAVDLIASVPYVIGVQWSVKTFARRRRLKERDPEPDLENALSYIKPPPACR